MAAVVVALDLVLAVGVLNSSVKVKLGKQTRNLESDMVLFTWPQVGLKIYLTNM